MKTMPSRMRHSLHTCGSVGQRLASVGWKKLNLAQSSSLKLCFFFGKLYFKQILLLHDLISITFNFVKSLKDLSLHKTNFTNNETTSSVKLNSVSENIFTNVSTEDSLSAWVSSAEVGSQDLAERCFSVAKTSPKDGSLARSWFCWLIVLSCRDGTM